MKDNVFILRVNLPQIKGEHVIDKVSGKRDYIRDYPEYVTAIDFQNQSYMAFIITDYIETRSLYTVVFEDQLFKLQKQHGKKRWDQQDGLYSFRLCTTPQETAKELRGFIFQLLEARKDLLRNITKGGDTPWTAEEDDESNKVGNWQDEEELREIKMREDDET